MRDDQNFAPSASSSAVR